MPAGITRYGVALAAQPAPGFALPGLLEARRVEVVDDGLGFGPRIAARLKSAGVEASVVSRVSSDADGVVFGGGLSATESYEVAVAVQRAALQAARTLAQRSDKRFFVTLQDTGGDFGLSGRARERQWSGGLAGLAKTAAGEWPDAGAKAIDVATDGVSVDHVAERVVEELLRGGSDVEVGLDRAGTRGLVRHRAAPYGGIASETPRLRPGTVVIVSGGARGVTAASLASVCAHRPRLALLGRTTLVDEPAETRSARTDAEIRRALLDRAKAAGAAVQPRELAREAKLILDCREIHDNVARLRRAGAEVSYHPVDVRDADAVRSAVDEVRRKWGPIGGIIHGAGVLADASLGAQTDEQFDLVFGTKVSGLRHLLAATAGDPLETLILFSSVAGRFGNSGQAAYSMANDVLSCVAACERARRGPRCVVRALAWGPWAGGMVTPTLAKLFEKAGVQLVALEAGTAALAHEVETSDAWPQVILMNGDPPLVARPLNGGRVFSGEGRFELQVSALTQRCLDGHRIQGVAVVPAVMVLQWFLAAAEAAFPDQAVAVCRDLKVLRGLPVLDFDQQGIRLSVLLHAQSATTLALKLVDAQDKLRYTGFVELASAAPAPPANLPAAPADGRPWPISLEEAYAKVLFHRGAFSSVRSLGLVSDGGASGVVAGLRAPDAPWWTDVALMDGGVQVAALWGHHVLGRLPLPTRIGALHLYKRAPASAPVRCLVRGHRAGQHRVVADLAYVAEGGEVLGLIEEIDFHLPPVATRGTKGDA